VGEVNVDARFFRPAIGGGLVRVQPMRLAGCDRYVVERLGPDTATVEIARALPSDWEAVEGEPPEWAQWLAAAEQREAKRQAEEADRALALAYGWAALGFERFGAKNPALPGILRDLHAMGEASYTDGNDTLFMKALDPMYVEDDAT
jgi:hypothetical protein